MSELVASDRARARVRAFLSQDVEDSDSDGPARKRARQNAASDDSESDSDTVSGEALRKAGRHNRLGLGAKFDPAVHRPQMADDERRVAGSLRAASAREKARAAEEAAADGVSDDDGCEEDSRAAQLKAFKRTPHRPAQAALKSKPRLQHSLVSDTGKTVQGKPSLKSAVSSGKAAVVKRAVSFSVQRVQDKRRVQRGAGLALPSTSARGDREAPMQPRKRSKTRSRQKNLRRDTRSKDKLPAHLNEETLKKRLRTDGAPATRPQNRDGAANEVAGEVDVPWFEDRQKGQAT